MDKSLRRKLIAKGMPNKKWDGEPMMGGWYTEEEVEKVIQAVRSSMDWSVGFGFICDEIIEFEQMFAAYCGTKHAVSITSAGAGLDMAMRALDLQPGDEVIAPAINYKAGHYSILGHGGKLVFCEVDSKTLNASPIDIEKRITPQTRAILVTHMNGLSADMDAILEIAEKNKHPKYGPIKVIADAARACGAEDKNSKVGKKGWMTIFSFHTMKQMTTLGEGGMITTDDPSLAQELCGIRQWGMQTERWGGNYKMTKIQAAVGLVQLRRLDEMLNPRIQKAKERTEMLRDIPELTLPHTPNGYKHSYYLYTCLVPKDWKGSKRNKLMQILRQQFGVGSLVLNPPTYLDNSYISNHTRGQIMSLSEELGERIFCPSLHPLMTEADNEYIAGAISEAVDIVKTDSEFIKEL